MIKSFIGEKLYEILFLGLVILTFGCSNNSTNKKDMNLYDNSQITFEKFHPTAQKILTEEFYWSPIEETGPFGSDAGSDAFYGFRKWRRQNGDNSPVEYLDKLIKEWNFKYFDFKELNDSSINKYVNEYSIGDMALIDIDNAIIAVGFGQFVLEGTIDNDIHELTRIAIERELKPMLIELFRSEYHETRKQQLNKMKSVILDMKIKGSSQHRLIRHKGFRGFASAVPAGKVRIG